MCSMWRYVVPDGSEGKTEFVCGFCESPVNHDDEFCPECGTLFIEDITCENHPEVPAAGACIICELPYCNECGFRVNKLFLCESHSDYEIYEGMAKVFGTPEITEAEFIKSLLIQNGLHPVSFSRAGPYGGQKHMFSISETKEGSVGNLITEVKILVPCTEVINAEKILGER